MKPSIGRIVHYVSYGTPGGEFGKECRAAIITQVHQPEFEGQVAAVGLAVINPTGMFFNPENRYDGAAVDQGINNGGTWHWPERVE